MNSKFKIISSPNEAKEIWEQLSPHKAIDDEWDFREILNTDLAIPLHFIAGFDGDTLIGILPLQKNDKQGLSPKLLAMDTPYLEFFAGIDTDDNCILVIPGYEEAAPQFLEQIKEPAILTSLRDNYPGSEHYLDRFELDLTQFTDFEDFLQKNLDGRSRQRLINRLHKIDKSYAVEIQKGTLEDLPLLFQFSIDRFGERSSFTMLQRREIYKKLFERFEVDLFMIMLDGQPKAISFGIIHNGIYTTVNIGYDYGVRDISKYLVVSQLKRAMESGCHTFDAGQGDNGWKEHFHLRKIPQYKLTLNLLNPHAAKE